MSGFVLKINRICVYLCTNKNSELILISYPTRSRKIFKFLFFVGLVIQELIRLPHQRRRTQNQKPDEVIDDTLTLPHVLLDKLAFGGLEVVPAFYLFTPWLHFADYALPTWVGWVGVLLLGLALGLLWRAHQALGRQWSATLAIQTEHTLVMHGVYRSIRHPIYAALWLAAIAQACLLPNWVAGFAGLLCFLPLYLVRVPQEEQSMVSHFGEAYRSYMARTGRLLPRFDK